MRLLLLVVFAILAVSGSVSATDDETGQGLLSIKKTRAEPEACDERCQAAEQREIDGLAVQESIARSSQDVVTLTVWQVVVAALGLIALVVTLKFTRDSVRAANQSAGAAQDAVRVAQDTAKHELRAYVMVESISLSRFLNSTVDGVRADWFAVRAKFRNVGKTPAHSVQIYSRCRFCDPDQDPTEEDIEWSEAPAITVTPGLETFSDQQFFDIDTATQAFAGTVTIFFLATVRYLDIFEEARTTEVCSYIRFFRNPVEIMAAEDKEFGGLYAISAYTRGNQST